MNISSKNPKTTGLRPPTRKSPMTSDLSRRLAGVMELVEEVAFGRMDERLYEYLIEKSEDNRLEATHQKIANDLRSEPAACRRDGARRGGGFRPDGRASL